MEWVIGGIIAAIVGASMQMYASDQANRAAQKAMQEGNMQLLSSQDKINQKIAEAAAQYETGNREQNQAEEANRIASEIKTDVAESQAIRDSQQETAGNVSEDYKQARASSQAETSQAMNAFADLVGKIRSAGGLRLNESFKLNRYGEDISGLSRQAQGNYRVAQARAQDALHSKDGLANLGKIVSAVGTVMSMGGGAAAGAGTSAATAASTGATTGAAAGSSAGLASSAIPAITLAGLGGAGYAASRNPWMRKTTLKSATGGFVR